MTGDSGMRLGVVRGISYGLFGKADEFVPQARALGAGLLRAYVYWAQVEPEPGRYEWDTVDALLAQLDGDEEVWITVCSSSPWATRQPTDFLPPSPAHDTEAYARFVRRLVAHCGGRVRYWQCDNEPSNTGLLWAGTAEEYVAQLKAMHEAVRSVDPDALVVLGGCGYDALDAEPDSPPRRFFDHLAAHGADHFDVFDVHLYGEPTRIPRYVETARAIMRAHGYVKPVVAGEHGGPMLFEYPEVEATVQRVMLAAFTEAPAPQSTDELSAQAGRDTPERRAMTALYARMAELPEQLRMLMDGCPPELEAKRHRINCRQLAARTVLALASGIHRTAYWCLAPEVPGYHDPYQLMHLLHGKLPLLDYEGTALTHRHPAAHTFALLADHLHGATSAHRITVPDRPEVYAFHIERHGRPPLLAAWVQHDWFHGEDHPPVPTALPWPTPTATAIDALGTTPEVRVHDTRAHLSLTATPVLVH